jgi:hypothetical protein
MATGPMTVQPADATDRARFGRVAGLAAIGAGVAGLAYAVAFVVLQQPLLHGLFLMLGGLLMIVVLAGLSAWVRTAATIWRTRSPRRRPPARTCPSRPIRAVSLPSALPVSAR